MTLFGYRPFFVLTVLLLTACSSGRYEIRHDAAPLRAPTQLEMQDAEVANEPKSAAAGRPYTVRGQTYTPMLSEKGYQAEGVASWYGRKFHGYHTSNGEVFDMFSMTAAHKTLPLPSFVRVTNLENGKSVVVRVNDRGPFHDDRLIDLSYAAAYKLGYYHKGTAQVKLEAITLDDAALPSSYIQVAAAGNLDNIRALGEELKQKYQLGFLINEENGIFRLRLGPIENAEQAQGLLAQLKKDQFQRAFLLYSNDAL